LLTKGVIREEGKFIVPLLIVVLLLAVVVDEKFMLVFIKGKNGLLALVLEVVLVLLYVVVGATEALVPCGSLAGVGLTKGVFLFMVPVAGVG
jgi:hypothetical protein